MPCCPVCSSPCPEGAAACPGCAAAIRTEPERRGGTPVPNPGLAPGDVLADRYRIAALLGAGGMGQVYRAYDRRLEQEVAMKILPERFATDPDHRARFHAEVRTARQIAHPNVCRVYDIGEHDGRLFLTMEYVAGDDLRSLLRRVERLTEDRAVVVARQLCSAVAAVHDLGLLHRDLKPGNILIDEKGDVRLVDFGIAALAGGVTDVRSGTAAYQAPEVLAGREVTAASDLFALGLVLYEVFTGKPAFPARGRGERARMHDSGPAPPSAHLRTLDPAVERVILRCLKADPADRPRSAREVQAALPGALQAVLAEGQTPSPDFVADAGGVGAISRAGGAALLAAVVLGMGLFAWLTDLAGLHRRVPLKNPAVLRDRAAGLARQLGFANPVDSADGLLLDYRPLQPAPTPQQWRGLERGDPVTLFFWYRESPGRLVNRISPNDIMSYGIPGMVSVAEPPLGPGEVSILLDGVGRLVELHARPGRGDAPAGRSGWEGLFAAAGLDWERARPAGVCRDPGSQVTEHTAWCLPHPDSPETLLHVEAAARGGQPVYFWAGRAEDREAEDRAAISEVPPDLGTRLSEYAYGSIRLMALTVGAVMAWLNVRRGVANVAGANRLVAVYAGAYLLMWAFMAHHVASLADEWAVMTAAVGYATMNGLTLWVIYLALEPSVRRTHPEWMIGWNRLLDGRWRDPRVGRDVLIGAALGTAWAILMPLRRTLGPEAFGQPYMPYPVWMPALTMWPVGPMAAYVWVPLFFQLLEFFLLIIVLLVTRRLEAAVAIWGVFWTVRWSLWLGAPLSHLPLALAAVATALPVVALLRAGLLGSVAFGLFGFALVDLPVTLDRSAWYAPTGFAVLATLATLAVAAFRTATAERAAPEG